VAGVFIPVKKQIGRSLVFETHDHASSREC